MHQWLCLNYVIEPSFIIIDYDLDSFDFDTFVNFITFIAIASNLDEQNKMQI